MRSSRLAMFAGLVGLFALLAAGCTGGDTNVTLSGPEATGISVTGTGRASVTPDIARLSLGVESTQPTVAEATSEASAAMDAIRASLAEEGIEERDIRTQFFNIYPEFDFSGEQRQLLGFRVSNQVQVTVREIDSVSNVLDGAIAAGGDLVRVNGISFGVEDRDEALDQAREEAVTDARRRAERLAELSGVKLGAVKTISESFGGGGGDDFARIEAAAQDGGFDTPISPGESELTVTVFVVYEVD